MSVSNTLTQTLTQARTDQSRGCSSWGTYSSLENIWIYTLSTEHNTASYFSFFTRHTHKGRIQGDVRAALAALFTLQQPKPILLPEYFLHEYIK